jgi:pyruvate-formate lyase-activating enzyme
MEEVFEEQACSRAELKKQLNERDKGIEELKTSVNKIQKLTEFLNDLEPEHAAEFLRYRMEHKESLLEVPEPIAEIPITETFKKKVNALIEKKSALRRC